LIEREELDLVMKKILNPIWLEQWLSKYVFMPGEWWAVGEKHPVVDWKNSVAGESATLPNQPPPWKRWGMEC